MTIVIPKNYHAWQNLEKNRVECISDEQAQQEDIRALRIGILNIMPNTKSYEFNLLQPLGRTVLQIIPIWLKLKSHKYSSSNASHLNELYFYFDHVLEQGLDGMIVTGAPVEKLDYDQVNYWDEIKEILEVCRQKVASTLGICWGGLALAHLLGIEKENYPTKLFGLFETYNLNTTHRITGNLDDVFWLPQSRHAGLPDHSLEQAAKRNEIKLLASCKQGGYPIFESADERFLVNLGHFEYNAHRIVEEANRDAPNTDVPPPENFDLKNPLNRWRGQRNEFFSQWIRYCHHKTQSTAG